MTHWDLIRKDARQLQPRTAQEWNQVVAMLHEHALEGYVYSCWQEKLPYHAARLLQIEWKLQTQRNLAYFGELSWLGQHCQSLGVRPTLLKGAALIGDIYEDVGSRSMADIDLLVRAEEIEKVVALLKERGYEEVDSTKWEANEFKRLLSRKWQGIELVFELHERLFYGEEGVAWIFEDSAEPGFRKLAPEDTLVHLMGHLGYQHTFLHLTWLVDIDLFIRKHGNHLDWNRVMSLCSALDQRRSASATLWACREYLGTPVPGNLMVSRWKSVLSEEFLWTPKEHSFRYYLIKHLMKDSWKEALTYDWLWLRRRAWR